jgi:signal peptidase I
MPMSGGVSQPPPSPAAAPLISPAAAGAYGRPVRLRIAVPLLLAVGVAMIAALVLLHDHVVYYRIDSGSMQPTLRTGSRVAVEPGLSPEVGDIVAFRAPAGAVPATPACANPGQGAGFMQPCGLATPGLSHATFVKRIVAGPGDAVFIRAGHAVVNGVPSAEPFAAACGGADCNFPTPIRVPPGQFYVLGDNRGASDDSRFWGPITSSSVIGVLVTCRPLQTACQPRH